MAKTALRYSKFYENPDAEAPEGGLENELSLVQKFYKLEKKAISTHIHFACRGCPRGMRKAVCKHVVALGLAKNLFKVPSEKSLKQIKRYSL